MADMLSTRLGLYGEQSLTGALRLLVELAAQFVGASEGSLLVLDEEGRDLVFAMVVGAQESQQALLGTRVPVGKGITGLAAQTHEVQIGAPTFGTAQPVDPRSVLAAPVLIDDRLIGVITAVSFAPDKRFTSEDAKLYARVAAAVGVAVDQARRLRLVEALQSGQAPPAPANAEERLDAQILDSVRRLLRARGEAKERAARILGELAAMSAD